MEKSIKSIEELLSLFRNTTKHFFYLGHLFGTSLLNLNDFMPTFEIISCYDPFMGACPFIKVPKSLKDCCKCASISACPVVLLKNRQVIQYMKSKDPHPSVITVIITEEAQKLCRENGIDFWGVSAELYNYLGNKVKIVDLLQRANIPFIPNVCSKISSYKQLKQVSAHFNTDSLVVQDQFGISGRGTIFISNQKDYQQFQPELENGNQFKIMPFKRLKAFAIGGVTLKSGTVMGPLQSELIGHEQLTPFRGGYCGNQIRRSYFEDEEVELRVREEMVKYSVDFCNFLHKELNFRGLFGIDYVVDMDTNEVFFMEINPRLTGSTSLAFQYYQAHGHKFPIILYHCLEYLGMNLDMDIEALNKQWIGLDNYEYQVSHLATKGMTPEEIRIPVTFPAGIWRMENGVGKFTGRTEFRVSQMSQEDVFYIPNKGFAKGNIIIKKRCQDYNFKLTQESKSLVNWFIDLRLKDMKMN